MVKNKKKKGILVKTLMLLRIRKEDDSDKDLQWILKIQRQPNGMYNLIDILNQIN